MAEYVVEEPSDRSASWRVHERIVRCRDCKWCMAYSEATYCDRFAHELPTVEPDGFCAWGERKGE
jgi:hypothetical protein